MSNKSEYRAYLVWDAPTRWFHWINAISVIGLIATGLVVLNGDMFGLSSDGKVALKSVHASFGYVMAINLIWRFVWAFFGNRYARWRAVLPGGAGFMAALRAYVASFLSGEPLQYIGHNPLARIGVSVLFLLLLVQVATGLVLAGTDLLWPPFGRLFAEWIAAPGVEPGVIQPGASDLIDKTAYQSMRNFRAPFVEVHEITFYLIATPLCSTS
jgi:Ni/Fe-hydrogenase b-type cytochrome subunit